MTDEFLDSTGRVVVPFAHPTIDPWKEYIRCDLVEAALDLPGGAASSLANVCAAAKQGAKATK